MDVFKKRFWACEIDLKVLETRMNRCVPKWGKGQGGWRADSRKKTVRSLENWAGSVSNQAS